MNSMQALANDNKSFGPRSVFALFIAGYVALTGSTLWALNRQDFATTKSIQKTPQVSSALICDSCYDAQRRAATN